MAKLIVTTSDSGAGHLKQERIAHRVVSFTHRLVWGAVPEVAEEADFLTVRTHMARREGEDWAYWDAWEGEPSVEAGDAIAAEVNEGPIWAELISTCDRYSEVELWLDPTPNEQLLAIQLLSRLAAHPGVVERLSLVHADAPLGGRAANGLAHLEPRRPVRGEHLDLARRAWTAFRRPTPQDWFALLETDLAVLPHLRGAVLEMLDELPDATTALGASEATLLSLVVPDGAAPYDVFPGHLKRNSRRVFGYWETGLMLDRLSSYPDPVIAGLDERPFTLALHQAEARHLRYRRSHLTATPLGRRLSKRRDDLARHNAIARWWGGVKLTNAALWRWDATSRRLIPPS